MSPEANILKFYSLIHTPLVEIKKQPFLYSSNEIQLKNQQTKSEPLVTNSYSSKILHK